MDKYEIYKANIDDIRPFDDPIDEPVFQRAPSDTRNQRVARFGKSSNALFKREKKQQTPEQLRAAQRSAFEQLFLENKLTLSDLEPWRVSIVWRITRQILSLMGRPNDVFLKTVDPTLWTEPRNIRAFKVDPQWTRARNLIARIEGLGLAPHPYVPFEASLAADANIHQENDLLKLETFCEVIREICVKLELEAGTRKDPAAGRYGLAGLLKKETVRRAWPSREALLDYEEWLLGRTWTKTLDGGAQLAHRWLAWAIGVNYDEAQILTRLAAERAAKANCSFSADEARAIQIARFERVASEAKAAFNIREQINALKEISKLQGLNHEPADDAMKDFQAVVARVSREGRFERDEAKQVEALSVHAIPYQPTKAEVKDPDWPGTAPAPQ